MSTGCALGGGGGGRHYALMFASLQRVWCLVQCAAAKCRDPKGSSDVLPGPQVIICRPVHQNAARG